MVVILVVVVVVALVSFFFLVLLCPLISRDLGWDFEPHTEGSCVFRKVKSVLTGLTGLTGHSKAVVTPFITSKGVSAGTL